MKKILLPVLLIAALATACTKKTEPTPTTTTPTTTTNPMEGDWKVDMYDGMKLTAPASGTYKVTKASATTGAAVIDVTFDGTAHSTENADYTLSNSNANVDYVNTGGSFKVLSGGNTWKVDTLTSNVLRMTSKFGLIIRMTK